MTALQHALADYRLAAEASIERYRISCPPARAFSQATARLSRLLTDEGATAAGEQVLASARSARWRAGTEAVPFDAAGSTARTKLLAVIDGADGLADLVDEDLQMALRALSHAGQDLLMENNQTLSEAVLQSLEDGDPTETCAVVTDTRARQAAEIWLRHIGAAFPVLRPRDLMNFHRWDFAVVIGASDWYPGWLFTCPRATQLTLVHHAHLRDAEYVSGIFGPLATVPLSVRIHGEKAEDPGGGPEDPQADVAAEQQPQPAWPELLREANAHTDEATGEERVTARLLVLSGGHGLWLPLDAKSIRGLDLAAPEGERVLSLSADTVTTDSVLLLREGGSFAGALKTMADAILGSSASVIRSRQDEWKALLRAEIERIGARHFESALRRRGLKTVNLRYWAGADTIRPLRDDDFALLLRYLGVRDPGPYLSGGRSLWRAHQRAAAELTTALEALVERADLHELEESGHQRLHLADQSITATLTAYRVIAVNPKAQDVTVGATRRPFTLRSARWLE
ncbi:hypothetical protein ACI780_18085 [Geodermatophilus sp. SYSU D00814]